LGRRHTLLLDLGGVMIGGEYDRQEFLAECKKYAKPQDQGVAYLEYLARCYRAFMTKPDRCNNFMWPHLGPLPRHKVGPALLR
jgi:hypothetical protein